jgi:hypothetical protein
MIAFGPSSQLCLWGNSAPVPRCVHFFLTQQCVRGWTAGLVMATFYKCDDSSSASHSAHSLAFQAEAQE